MGGLGSHLSHYLFSHQSFPQLACLQSRLQRQEEQQSPLPHQQQRDLHAGTRGECALHLRRLVQWCLCSASAARCGSSRWSGPRQQACSEDCTHFRGQQDWRQRDMRWQSKKRRGWWVEPGEVLRPRSFLGRVNSCEHSVVWLKLEPNTLGGRTGWDPLRQCVSFCNWRRPWHRRDGREKPMQRALQDTFN